jgi:GH24 family phage-related lysozyme (muramidase)
MDIEQMIVILNIYKGVVINGLTRRRTAESKLYFTS